MRHYRENHLLNFARQWAWIASDRVFEFDDVIRRPINSLECLHAATEKYSRKRVSIPPQNPDSDIAKAFQAMLGELAENGEDVDRVYDWAYCLTPFMQDTKAQLAMRLWINTFTRFAQGKRERAKHVDEDLMEQLSLSYAAHVLEPSLQLSLRCRQTSEVWLENDARKSDFDKMLWRFFFERSYMDPSVYVSSGHRDVLVREWWRRERKALNQAQIAGLRMEQHDNMRAHSRKLPTWLLDDSIVESLLVDGFPEFDKVAKSSN
ncbi:hypothetical protein [Mesorhizobium sp. M0217]|uniref:hypothetical protein n=1 Tax=unclassified Mesorhizobium TaxID=325217 RepID=UPI003334DFFB